mgnify:CR=1 FL=1
MYEEFIKETSKFIFAENKPEKADIIFVPGNGYSQMAEKAAQLYAKKYAPFVLPSGKYSISTGRFGGVLTGQKRYSGEYQTEWEFLKDVLIEEWCAGGCCSEGKSGDIYLGKCKVFQKSYRSGRY